MLRSFILRSDMAHSLENEFTGLELILGQYSN